MADNSEDHIETLLVQGKHGGSAQGYLMPPVQHASTVVFPTIKDLEARSADKYNGPFYGRIGTTTTFALEEAIARLEGGYRSVAVCSGTAACAVAILGFARAGDHILLPDTVWGSVRKLADGLLSTLGIESSFYDPLAGEDELAALVRPNTKVLYLESPGSLTLDIQDVPQLVGIAKRHGLTTILDNTWSSPVFFHPLRLGVDVSVIAATKYIVGNSDAMVGLVVCNQDSYLPVRETASALGYHAAPDDCYLAYRGLSTAAVRLRAHETSALALARWLHAQPEVARVFHPALESHPGHALWKRDFSGASGLFSIELHPTNREKLEALVDGLRLFAKGGSWGGVQSLVTIPDIAKVRSVHPWTGGPLLRFHVGLESLADLQNDLQQGFDTLRAIARQPGQPQPR